MKHRSKIVAVVLLCLFSMITAAGYHAIAEDKSGFLSVTGPCNLVFPKDHGSHPGYRTEWWYYTGNLKAETGNRYGFQLTFFRSQISAPGDERRWPQPHAVWRTRQIYLGHSAVTDILKNRHLQSELMARGTLGMAGVSQKTTDTQVFIKNWSANIGANRHLLKAVTDAFSYELRLKPAKPPVLHGQAGYSRKGSAPERASCYYSFSRLKTDGALTIGGKKTAVDGLSWMDHEFSTASLEPGIIGWDWFSLQLSDQTEIMLYLLRKEQGRFSPVSSGTFIDGSGRPHHLAKDDFKVDVLDTWQSPRSRAVYPVHWRLTVFPLAIELTAKANILDQEMQTQATTGVTYWEGSISIKGSVGKYPVKGWGYAELTGYAQSFNVPM
ncbi:MAG: lipocalin-like domain-containing protein [Desulfobacterales bacterium]|jgi:predicted secreted hydrolase